MQPARIVRALNFASTWAQVSLCVILIQWHSAGCGSIPARWPTFAGIQQCGCCSCKATALHAPRSNGSTTCSGSYSSSSSTRINSASSGSNSSRRRTEWNHSVRRRDRAAARRLSCAQVPRVLLVFVLEAVVSVDSVLHLPVSAAAPVCQHIHWFAADVCYQTRHHN